MWIKMKKLKKFLLWKQLNLCDANWKGVVFWPLANSAGDFHRLFLRDPRSLLSVLAAELDSYTNNHNSSCRKHTWMSNQMGQWEASSVSIFRSLQTRRAASEKCHLAWEPLNSCLEPKTATYRRVVNRSHFPNWTHKKVALVQVFDRDSYAAAVLQVAIFK